MRKCGLVRYYDSFSFKGTKNPEKVSGFVDESLDGGWGDTRRSVANAEAEIAVSKGKGNGEKEGS